MTDKRITMEDIATEMNIAKSTVSIAIADKYGVSEEMRSKIILKAIEMGYDFSQVKIKPNRRKRIALIIEDNSSFKSPFWMEIIKGVEQKINSLKYQLKIIVRNQYDEMGDIFVDISTSKIAGVIIMAGETHVKELLAGFKQLNINVVLIDSLLYFTPQCDEVRSGNYNGGIACAEHFIKKGHKNFLYLGYTGMTMSICQRFYGFLYGLDYYGGYTANRYLCSEDVHEASDEINKMLDTISYPVAIFCANDYLAQTLWFYAQKRGINIPNEISIVGFDNSPEAGNNELTTFNVPKKILGERAVELLVSKINNSDKPTEIIDIAVELVERKSVKDLTKNGKR